MPRLPLPDTEGNVVAEIDLGLVPRPFRLRSHAGSTAAAAEEEEEEEDHDEAGTDGKERRTHYSVRCRVGDTDRHLRR